MPERVWTERLNICSNTILYMYKAVDINFYPQSLNIYICY